VVAETGAAAALGQMDVDISEAGEGWGDEDIIIDEGTMSNLSALCLLWLILSCVVIFVVIFAAVVVIAAVMEDKSLAYLFM